MELFLIGRFEDVLFSSCMIGWKQAEESLYTVVPESLHTPRHFHIECHSKQVVQNIVFWTQKGIKISKVWCQIKVQNLNWVCCEGLLYHVSILHFRDGSKKLLKFTCLCTHYISIGVGVYKLMQLAGLSLK